MKKNREKPEKNAKLSQTRVDYGDMRTKCDVASCTGSWDRQRTVMGKLGKSESNLEFNNKAPISVSHEGERDEDLHRNLL